MRWHLQEVTAPPHQEASYSLPSLPQIQTQWWMGETPKLSPVNIPDNLDAAGKTIMRSLAQMVLDCTQHEPNL